MSFALQKRKLAPSILADGAFSIIGYPVAEEPSIQDVYALNFFSELLVPKEDLEPVRTLFTFTYGCATYTLQKLRVQKRITPADN